ncbi:hypothetical protein [Dyella sp. OK004]|nr:hypothetical protein [Dyella sp. OK004]
MVATLHFDSPDAIKAAFVNECGKAGAADMQQRIHPDRDPP